MVLCKDCKHCKLDNFFYWIPFTTGKYEFAKCTRQKKIDMVSGKETVVRSYCTVERNWDCGKEGKYFEAV